MPELTRALYYPFQFEVSIRKAAKHLVPPKTLPKPRLQPQSQHPFSVVKLRHVDQTQDEETKSEPQPESADPPAPSSSCHSAVQFMSRVLQRLREVDEHISEVITISSFNSLTSSFCLLCLCPLFKPVQLLRSLIPKKGPRVNVDYILCPDYTFRLV